MKESEQIVRILSARHISVPLLALAAVASVSRADVLRDPTQPANVRAEPEPTSGVLRVEAIFMNGNHRVAIVNGVLVRMGERIGGAVINGIESDHISYTRDGASGVARLPRSNIAVRSDARAESGS